MGDLMYTNRNMVWRLMIVCLILEGTDVISAVVSAGSGVFSSTTTVEPSSFPGNGKWTGDQLRDNVLAQTC